MTDKELLELAAKAAGFSAFDWLGNDNYMNVYDDEDHQSCWNPLTDDGDAFRLAVKLNIVVWEHGQYDRAMAEVRYGEARGEYWELSEDPYAATRRAIVRAAAEIGKDMK